MREGKSNLLLEDGGHGQGPLGFRGDALIFERLTDTYRTFLAHRYIDTGHIIYVYIDTHRYSTLFHAMLVCGSDSVPTFN